jgi:nitroreductase
MDAIEALTSRVSGSKLVEPAPDELELHSLLTAATRAPDHGRLRPWRFIVLRGDALKRFGDLMADTYLRRNPAATPAQLDKERGKPLRAPLILVIAAKVNEQSNIPAIEQVLSAGAAAENVMVGAYALGYGCAWKTGEAAYDEQVKAAFGLAPTDAIVGFMYLGTNAIPPANASTVDVDEYVREWPETN